MVRHIGVHRSNHAHVVDHFTDMRKQLTDLDATLAVFFEFKGRSIRSTRLPLRSQIIRNGLPMKLVESWLGIKRVNLRRPTVHEQVDYRLSLGLKMRLLGEHRVRISLPGRLTT